MHITVPEHRYFGGERATSLEKMSHLFGDCEPQNTKLLTT
ncbi:hypothetical protein FTV88_1955 [Heliorestis convoluta]|uniref:Uncharacterized protein n=1 Tax=Heliorestis convoluta TaxID=356322 RepID=A0A5Q2N2F6_9FIRM|nr:hypothetical protein FTV88_1955 [Heliorestis convoluta]